jgi:hypothetical protein
MSAQNISAETKPAAQSQPAAASGANEAKLEAEKKS